MESIVTERLSTLGHPQRLAILRLLMRRYPGRVAAGEIADALKIRPSTLSAYLAALMRTGLVEQERTGTSLRYTVVTEAVQGTLQYLLLDCCRGRPEICLPDASAAQKGGAQMPRTDPYRVLFICTGNSARSIFAEALLRSLGGARFEAYSAGTRPRSELNPHAVAQLAQKGHDISILRAKNIAEFQGPDAPALDFVFTVCDRAANEECPAWPGQPITAHWGTVDPVKAEGTEAEKALAFQQAYGALRNRILAFTELPFDALDTLSLQRAVDDIGRDTVEAGA